MHRFVLLAALLGATAALALSCSDDTQVKTDKGPIIDKGSNLDKPLVTPDKPVTTPDGKPKTDGPLAKKVEEYMIQSNEVSGWVFGPPCGITCTPSGTECGTHTCLSTNKCSCIQAAYTILDMEAIVDGSNDPYRCAEDCAVSPKPAASCGNGACEDGEDSTGCPADCVGDPPKSKVAAVCGNGKCERDDPGENGFAYEEYSKGTLQIILYLWDLTTQASAKKMFEFDKSEEQKAGRTPETLTGIGQEAFDTSTTAKYQFFAYKGHYIAKMFAIPKSDATIKTEATTFLTTLMSKLP
jgi:hypothetical protein